MRKVFFLLLSFFLVFPVFGFNDINIKDNIIPDTSHTIINVSGPDEGLSLLDTVLLYIKDSMFNLLALVTIGVFIYIGYLLISARGNQEVFKRAMMAFVYASTRMEIL